MPPSRRRGPAKPGRGFAVVASEVKALAEQTAKATGEISQQISGIQAATQELVGAIKEIGDTIGRMSEIASTIAAAVEEQGAATQEIARNVQQAAHGTQQVSANIADVQRGASETGSASSQVLTAAKSLSGESDRLKRARSASSSARCGRPERQGSPRRPRLCGPQFRSAACPSGSCARSCRTMMVVVHGNAERFCDVDDRFGHLDVGLRRGRIAGRVIVHQDQRARRQFQRALDHLARIDRRVVDGAGLLVPRPISAGCACRGTAGETAPCRQTPLSRDNIVFT